MSEWNPNTNAFYGGHTSQRSNDDGENYSRQRSNNDQQHYLRQGGQAYNSPQNYVGFNDFVNQFQQANTGAPGNHYNNAIEPNPQYMNSYRNSFPQVQQFNSEYAVPSQYFENQPRTLDSGAGVSSTMRNSGNAQDMSNSLLTNPVSNVNAYNQNIASRSNLTPTATEFVPKQVATSSGGNFSRSEEIVTTADDVADNSEPTSSNEGQKYLRSRVWNSRPSNQPKQREDRFKSGNDPNIQAVASDQTNDIRKFNNYRNDRNNYTQRNGRQYDGENWRSNSSDYSNKGYGRTQPTTSRERSTFTSSETFTDGKDSQIKKFDDGKFKRRIKIENPKDVKYSDVELTQRDTLSEQLNRGILECLVCCDRVRQTDEIWSCGNCYHVLHLKCITKWASSSVIDSQWRCPACQNCNSVSSLEYLCLCGRRRPSTWRRGDTAHSCGQLCSRPRPPRCPHPCTLLCHPGPCPPCQAVIIRKCECGATSRSVICSSETAILCGKVCDRTLNCGKHKCGRHCHVDNCSPCEVVVDQECGCPKAEKRSVACEYGVTSSFACDATCGRLLTCGLHSCTATCHTGPCPLCPTRPEAIKTCPCGQTKLTAAQSRRSCVEPVPLCNKVCSKPLACGGAVAGANGVPLHMCQSDCHEGPCPPCLLATPIACRCKHSTKDVLCVRLDEEQDNVRCQKKCNKAMVCGKHHCRVVCCGVVGGHSCPRSCGRPLGCSGHRCPLSCHAGTCPPCQNISFTELRCMCGASVVPPPVACGVRVQCRRECVIVRACGHPTHHSCHQPPSECPPCLVQTTKCCFGGHEERKTIPCHQEEFSCGMPCGKPLVCGKHKCLKVCHKGECESEPCKQPCQEARSSCGHPCAAPCHFGAKDKHGQVRPGEGGPDGDGDGEEDAQAQSGCRCPGPVAACKAQVRATCQCGHRTNERPCAENTREYQRLASGLLASRMQDVQLGLSIDLADILGSTKSGASLKTLECTEECRVVDRNRRLAIALQIRNPDLSSKLTPRYSDFMKEWMQRDTNFCQNVHEKLTELVQLAKKSKQKTRSYSFPSTNRQKRQFIHEMCEHFGCESVSYDEEPNRNVVATADKEKSWLPAKSIMEVVGRQNGGVRRVPGPILRPTSNLGSSSTSSTTMGGSAKGQNAAGRSGGAWATLTSNYSGALTRNNNDEAKTNTSKK